MSGVPQRARYFFRAIRRLRNWDDYFFNLRLGRQGRVTYRLRGGANLIIREGTADRSILGEILVHDIYELDSLGLTKGDVVLDFGAHIGVFAVVAGFQGANVWAFEPNQGNFALLQENVTLNGLEKHVFPFNEAVSDTSGMLPFYACDHPSVTSCDSFHSSGANWERRMVKATTLAEILKKHSLSKVDLLKCDIEQAEYEVFYNSEEALRAVDRIILEYHHDAKDMTGRRNREALRAFLEGLNFNCHFGDENQYGGILFAQR